MEAGSPRPERRRGGGPAVWASGGRGELPRLVTHSPPERAQPSEGAKPQRSDLDGKPPGGRVTTSRGASFSPRGSGRWAQSGAGSGAAPQNRRKGILPLTEKVHHARDTVAQRQPSLPGKPTETDQKSYSLIERNIHPHGSQRRSMVACTLSAIRSNYRFSAKRRRLPGWLAESLHAAWRRLNPGISRVEPHPVQHCPWLVI